MEMYSLAQPCLLPCSMQVQHEPTAIHHVHAQGRGWAFNQKDELHTQLYGEGHPDADAPAGMCEVLAIVVQS